MVEERDAEIKKWARITLKSAARIRAARIPQPPSVSAFATDTQRGMLLRIMTRPIEANNYFSEKKLFFVPPYWYSRQVKQNHRLHGSSVQARGSLEPCSSECRARCNTCHAPGRMVDVDVRCFPSSSAQDQRLGPALQPLLVEHCGLGVEYCDLSRSQGFVSSDRKPRRSTTNCSA
jgi:hypothetical protein